MSTKAVLSAEMVGVFDMPVGEAEFELVQHEHPVDT